jgi:LEA14-like dessication related protein
MKKRIIVFLVALGGVITGCATLGMNKFQDPTIELTSVAVRSFGLTGGSLDLLLNVTNPNNFDLKGTRLDLGLDVENTHFGDVQLTDAFNLPKGKLTTVVVPMSFEWAGVGAAARSAMSYGTVKYVIKGTASLQTPFGLERVPFSRDGTVALNTTRPGTTPAPPQ